MLLYIDDIEIIFIIDSKTTREDTKYKKNAWKMHGENMKCAGGGAKERKSERDTEINVYYKFKKKKS